MDKEFECLNGLIFNTTIENSKVIGYEVECLDCQDKKVVIPSNINGLPVIRVKARGFEDCGSSEIVLPDTIKEIGEFAFAGSSNLKSITLPFGLQKIDEGAFSECENLRLSTLPTGIKVLSNYVFSGCKCIEKFIIPDTVEEIGDGAFDGSGLECIEIPSSVNKVSQTAFSDCSEDLIILFAKKLEKQIQALDIYEGEDGYYPIMDQYRYHTYYIETNLDSQADLEFVSDDTFTLGAQVSDGTEFIVKTKSGRCYKRSGFWAPKYKNYEE